MRLPLVRALTIAATLSAVVTGCSWIGDGESSPTSTTVAAPTTTAVPPALEVLDPGAEPRRVLELRFVEGDTATAQLTSDLKITDVDGVAVLDPPPVVQTVRFDIDRVNGDEADVSFEVLSVKIDDSAGTLDDTTLVELTVDLYAVIGLKGTGTIDRRGQSSAFRYDVPDDFDAVAVDTLDQLEQDVAAMGVPLPEVPLGLGARWRARDTIRVNGVRSEQVITYEISAIDGETVSYSATVEQSSPAQDLPDRTLPAGTTARLLAASARGTMTGTLQLGSVVSMADLVLSGQQKVEITDAKGSSTVSHDIDVTASVRPVP